jgi:hypothetical protein
MMLPAPFLIRRIVEQAFNQGYLAAVDEVLAPGNHTHITFGGVPNGPQGLKQLITSYRLAFPDLHCTVEDEIRGSIRLPHIGRCMAHTRACSWGIRPQASKYRRMGLSSPNLRKEELWSIGC